MIDTCRGAFGCSDSSRTRTSLHRSATRFSARSHSRPNLMCPTTCSPPASAPAPAAALISRIAAYARTTIQTTANIDTFGTPGLSSSTEARDGLGKDAVASAGGCHQRIPACAGPLRKQLGHDPVGCPSVPAAAGSSGVRRRSVRVRRRLQARRYARGMRVRGMPGSARTVPDRLRRVGDGVLRAMRTAVYTSAGRFCRRTSLAAASSPSAASISSPARFSSRSAPS